jgi:DNA-directed RNA polymerase beta subunit
MVAFMPWRGYNFEDSRWCFYINSHWRI